jgi:hypothetical protein
MQDEIEYTSENTPDDMPEHLLYENNVGFFEQEHTLTMGKLALALSKAQLKIEGAKKDSTNPYFKSKYADLASVWDACHLALNENEIAIIQTTSNKENAIIVHTFLIHSSGEWIKGSLGLMPVKYDPQGIGSAISYGRRYALSAMAGVCPIDDDGEAAMGRKTEPTYKKTTKKESLARLKEEASKGPLAKQKIIKLMKDSKEWSEEDINEIE